jgi:hypothetical protein
MGQPPPTTRYRVPGGGEPYPQGAGEGAPPPAHRRPAPTPRGDRSPTRSTGLAAGRDHRDPRHDSAMAPAADRPEVDVHADAARPSRDHAGDLVAHSADGHRESGVGLHAHPGGAEEPGPRRGQEHGGQGAQGQRDSAGLGSADLLADVPTGPLGRHRGGRLLHQRGLDPSRADHLLHALRDRSPKPTGSCSGARRPPRMRGSWRRRRVA